MMSDVLALTSELKMKMFENFPYCAFIILRTQIKNLIVTVRQRSFGKVMFSQVFVCSRG